MTVPAPVHMFSCLYTSHLNTNKQAAAVGCRWLRRDAALRFAFSVLKTDLHKRLWVLAAIWVGILSQKKPSGHSGLSFHSRGVKRIPKKIEKTMYKAASDDGNSKPTSITLCYID